MLTLAEWKLESARLLRILPEDADSGPALLGVVNDFPMSKDRLYLIPEAVHFTVGKFRVYRDVVEGNHAAVSHQRRVHFKVFFDTLIAMIAVDKKEVDLLPGKQHINATPCCRAVRISFHQG